MTIDPRFFVKQDKIWLALGCLHFSAVLYFLLGLGLMALLLLANEEEGGIAAGICVLSACFGIGLGVEVVAYGVRCRKFWGWVTGLCVFGVYLPSLFFPLGALGLWGLLDEGSREAFGIGIKSPHGRV
jgi:xanthine/uracil/vitamin C permease (AzgA family)